VLPYLAKEKQMTRLRFNLEMAAFDLISDALLELAAWGNNVISPDMTVPELTTTTNLRGTGICASQDNTER
jgi:hypothetical protein